MTRRSRRPPASPNSCCDDAIKRPPRRRDFGQYQGRECFMARTRILVLTGEVELRRLLRSLLEPNGRQVVSSPVPRDDSATNNPFDIVIVDLESLRLDEMSQVRACIRMRKSSRSAAPIARRTASPFWTWAPTISRAPFAREICWRACELPSCGNSKQKGTDVTTAAGRSSLTCSIGRSSWRASRSH